MLKAPRAKVSIQLDPIMAQKRISEHAIAEKIHVLLHLNDIPAEMVKSFIDCSGVVAGQHGRKLRFSQILQAVSLGPLDELIKIDWLVDFCQRVVAEVVVPPMLHLFQFTLEQ